MGPGVVINVREQAKNDSNYQVTTGDLQKWEKNNGEIPQGKGSCKKNIAKFIRPLPSEIKIFGGWNWLVY
jgi:hypothetical protein